MEEYKVLFTSVSLKRNPGEDSVISMSLILDQSERNEVGQAVKILYMHWHSGRVSQRALSTDSAVTKKMLGSSEKTKETLKQELGPNVGNIRSICSDGFVAQIGENVLLGKDADIKAAELEQNEPGRLKVESEVYPNSVLYDLSCPIAVHFILYCKMHADGE